MFKGEVVNIRTIIFGDEKKPVLVLIHGYGASGPTFGILAKKLCEHFCFITIDIIGMGSSSRPKDYDWNKFTPEQSNEYFVEYLEKWRESMGNHFLRSGEEREFTQFYLAGHSFGGYISAQYALKYHKHIKKLLLISPIGVNPRTPEERTNVYERFKRRA